MTPKPPPYKKFPGKPFSLFVKASLWKGPDHLIWVERSMMFERYKRFYYNDIQALVLVKNGLQHLWTTIWGALAFLFCAVALSFSGPSYTSSFFGVLCIIILGINLFKGPCCTTYLRTRVQQQKLTQLVRIKKASKVLDQIRNLVEETQGILTSQTISQSSSPEKMAGQVNTSINDTTNQNLEQSIDEPGHIKTSLHWGLYGLLGVMGTIKISQYWQPSYTLIILELVCLASLLVLAIITLVQHRGENANKALLTFDWIALALVILQSVAAYVIFILVSLRYPGIAYNTFELLRAFISMLNEGNPVITGLGLGFGLTGLVVGISGCAILTTTKK